MLDRFLNKKIILIAATSLMLLFIVHLRGCVSTPPTSGGSARPPTFLKTTDKEAIRVDTVNHTITVATPTGTKTEYVRNPVVHLDENGRITVDRKLYGFECDPFFAIGYGGGLRAYLGISWVYTWRLDLNTQIGFAGDPRYPTFAPVVSVSYNFWRSTSVFVGTDPVNLVLHQPETYHAGILVHF